MEEEPEAMIPTKDVVVATQAIDAGATIGAEMISLRAVPLDETNRHAFGDPRDVIGRITAIDVLVHQVLAPNFLEPSTD